MERLARSRSTVLKGIIALLIVMTALIGCGNAQEEQPAAESTNQGDTVKTENC